MNRIVVFCALMLSSTLVLSQSFTLVTIKQKEKDSAENFFVEVSKELFKRAEMSLRVKPTHWIKAQKEVMRASPDLNYLITPLTRTPSREDDYDWILPLEKYQLQLISNDKSIDINDTNALKELPVCALRLSPAEEKLHELGFNNIRAQVQEKSCYEQLVKGKVKLVMSFGKVSSEKRFQQVGGSVDGLVYGLSFREETLYLASTKGVMPKDQRTKLADTFESMKDDGSYKKIRDKY